MMTLIHEGGFPMWFILLFGLLSLGSAARFALQADRRQVGFIWGMSLATLCATLAATAADLGATFHALGGDHDGRFNLHSPDGPLILLIGLGESMSPAIVGFAFLALTALLAAVGHGRGRSAAARS